MTNGQSKHTAAEPAIDVVGQQIARRYAQGFLGAAGDGVEAAVSDLDSVNEEVLGKNPRLLETLSSAFLEHDERIGIIDRVFGGRVDSNVLKLLKVLSQHDRMSLVREVSREARRLLNESQNRIEVLIRLATTVDQATIDTIAGAVQSKLGIEPILKLEVEPELIGGLEIRVGDKVYDGTLRTAFKRAHKSIVEQTIQAIETQPERFTLAG